MNSRFYGIAIAAVAAGFVAFGGTHLALAACKDDIAAVQAVVDKEQDLTFRSFDSPMSRRDNPRWFNKQPDNAWVALDL